MKVFETDLGALYRDECVTHMSKNMENESVDLVITSPPYNVNIDYDDYDDNLIYRHYFENMNNIFYFIYNKLKNDGRMIVNIPYEAKFPKEDIRVFFVADFWKMLKNIGFRWAGMVDLVEPSAPRVKLSAWGSWLSPSAPYIYNPKECAIICYKNQWKKERKDKSYFNDENKSEFIKLTGAQWDYKAETKGLTKANFSLDFPLNALKILSYENDVVFDPFMGSCTTALACEMLTRKWIGTEISQKYCKVGSQRLKRYVNSLKTIEEFFGDE